MAEIVAMLEPLLDYGQMAAELGVPVRSLRQLVYKGVVPHLRLGHRTVKFQRSQIEKALRRREVKATK
jgi:excisionase family DNA binding protein